MLSDVNITNPNRTFYNIHSTPSNKNHKYDSTEKISEKLFKLPPCESIEKAIEKKQKQLKELLGIKLNKSCKKSVAHRKLKSDPEFLCKSTKTQKFFCLKKKNGFSSLEEKIDFGPIDYYNLKAYTYTDQNRESEMINNINRNKIMQSRNFIVRRSRVPLIITSNGAKWILNSSRKKEENKKLKTSFNCFFHRNSIFSKDNCDNNIPTQFSPSKSVKSKLKNKSIISKNSNINHNVKSNKESNKINKENKNKKDSTKSLIEIIRNYYINDYNYENSSSSDNDTNSNYINNNDKNVTDKNVTYKTVIDKNITDKSIINKSNQPNKSIKNIISNYIQKNAIISDNVTKSLQSNKNIHYNKKKLFSLEKNLKYMKKFDEYTDLYKKSKKDLDISSNDNNKNFSKNTCQAEESVKIRQKFCQFGTSTLNNLANQLANNQKKLNKELFKIIDTMNKKKKKGKEIDKVLEVILDKKIKKNKKSTAKQEYSDAIDGKKLLEERNKLKLLMKVGDMITSMSDEVVLNLTENLLQQNDKSKNEGFSNNKYKQMKEKKEKRQNKYLRKKMVGRQDEIELKIKSNLLEKDKLLSKYKSVIDKNKLIAENDKCNMYYVKTGNNSEERKIRYIKKEKEELLKLDFYKIFKNKNL